MCNLGALSWSCLIIHGFVYGQITRSSGIIKACDRSDTLLFLFGWLCAVTPSPPPQYKRRGAMFSRWRRRQIPAALAVSLARSPFKWLPLPVPRAPSPIPYFCPAFTFYPIANQFQIHALFKSDISVTLDSISSIWLYQYLLAFDNQFEMSAAISISNANHCSYSITF